MIDLLDRLARAAAGDAPAGGRAALAPAEASRLDAMARAVAVRRMTRRGILAGGGAVALSLGLGAHPRRAWSQVACGPGMHGCRDPQGGHCCLDVDSCCGDVALGHPCCIEGYGCCRGILCCRPGQDCCVGYLPRLETYGGSCCPPGVGCGTLEDGVTPCCLDHPGCCTADRRCGPACCPEGRFCCNPGTQACCGADQACCPVGPAGSTEESRTCCPPGHECRRQIVGDNTGVTPDSPTVCCPPERITRITQVPMCCPPGKVHMPGDVFTTRGSGTCCREDKICGDDCCESTPSFPMRCADGRCEFDLARILGNEATADRDGDVPVTMEFTGPARGVLSLQAPGGGPPAARSAADPERVLGRTRFRARRRGRRRLTVRLRRAARRELQRRGRLEVQAVITFRDEGRRLGSFKPMRLRAPGGRRRR